MTKTFKLVAGTALGLALVTGTGVAVTAAREQGPRGFMGQIGPGGPGRGPGGPGGFVPGLRALDLTETQREQVKAAMESHKAEFEAQATKMQAARQALDAVVTADTLDEAAIRQKSADVAVVEADGAVLRAKVHTEVWALLTPEQQQKAKTLQAQRESRRGQIRERVEQRRGQRQERRQQRD
jgi:Spy/CpxP family protein refolding chaperone